MSGIKLNQFIPKNCAVALAKTFDEFGSEAIDNLAVFDLKSFITLFGFVSKRFDDVGVKAFAARNEFPEPLTA